MRFTSLVVLAFWGAIPISQASEGAETLVKSPHNRSYGLVSGLDKQGFALQIETREINLSVAASKKSGLSDVAALTRGPKEASIFNETVRGVVLVISDDGVGSGALITKSGHIVTNLHVVGKATEVGIIFPPSDPSKKPSKDDLIIGKVLKVNEIKDLALIQVQKLPSSARPIVLATKPISVGDNVHAIGHPKNQLWTYTKGYVSQLRPGYKWTGSAEGPKHEADVIQTQTPINPGNSGGPLVNDQRELVGINSFKDPDATGLNYALHVSEIRSFLKQEGNIRQPNDETRKCGKNAVYSRENENKLSGKHLALGFDTDCDTKVDAELQIPHDKRKPHVFVIDTNDDGVWDIVTIDEDGDGKWDYSLLDTNYDGHFDHRGSHPDGKIIASRLVKIAN